MRKAGQVSARYRPTYSPSSKYISDEFEARMWVLFEEKGFESMCAWVSATLGTIITICLESILTQMCVFGFYSRLRCSYSSLNSDADIACFSDTRKRLRSDIENPSDDPVAKRAKTCE